MADDGVAQKTLRAFKKGQHKEALFYLPLVSDPKGLRAGYTIKGKFSSLGANLLHLSALHGWLGLAQDLINKYNFDLKEKDGWGQTALHYAIAEDQVNILQYLISHCPGLSLQTCDDSKEMTPLHYAADHGSLNAMKYLIDTCECNPYATNAFGNNCLHHSWGSIEVVRYLVSEVGCSPSLPGHNGKTLLHFAAENGALDVVAFLLTERRIQFGCVDRSGMTALGLALASNQTPVVYYMRQWQCYNTAMTDSMQNKGV